MKRIYLLLAVMIMATAGAYAQRPDMNPKERVENQLKRLDDQLDLTKDQEKKIRVILEEFHKGGPAPREDMPARRKEMNKKISEVLTDSQKKIYSEMSAFPKPGGRRK